MSNFLLEAKRIRVDYAGGYMGLKDVTLKLSQGDMLTVYGEEGAGKTTLLRALAGLEEISDGEIILGGKNLKEVPPKIRNLGYTFTAKVLGRNKNVIEILSYPMLLRGFSQEEAKGKAESMCDEYSIDKSARVKDMCALDVAKLILARLFSIEREVYLVDELIDGLDEKDKDEYYSLLLQKVNGKSVVTVTSDVEFARKAGENNLLILHSGEAEGQKSLGEISKRPRNMTSVQLCGYELFTGLLEESDGVYFAVLDEDGKRYKTVAPISRVYSGKRVCFALKEGEVKPFYYDLSSERIISREREII